MADQIASERPDVVLLSEGPPRAWLDLLHRELGPSWSLAVAANEVHSPYAYNLCVLVRGEVLASEDAALGPGIGLSTLATIDDHLIRVLLVDSPSNPFGWKVPFLEAVARSIQTASDEGRPFDVVAGDFNVPSRSVAFPPLESAGPGYHLAGRWAFGTRKTWPSPLPLVDLDHILIRTDRALFVARPIRSWRTDHMGLVVDLSATVETED
jgi:endonuclease/exonuclease/phosphatase (EEP) superfamily protein YafD